MFLIFLFQVATTAAEAPLISAGNIITGLIGALIALGLNRAFAAYDRSKKQDDIRKLIVSDLRAQYGPLEQLHEDLQILVPSLVYGYEQKEDEFLKFQIDYTINTDVFNSHSKMEYFKAFSVDDFYLLMSIYRRMKLYEEFRITEVIPELGNSIFELHRKFDELGKELKEVKDIQNIALKSKVLEARY